MSQQNGIKTKYLGDNRENEQETINLTQNSENCHVNICKPNRPLHNKYEHTFKYRIKNCIAVLACIGRANS